MGMETMREKLIKHMAIIMTFNGLALPHLYNRIALALKDLSYGSSSSSGSSLLYLLINNSWDALNLSSDCYVPYALSLSWFSFLIFSLLPFAWVAFNFFFESLLSISWSSASSSDFSSILLEGLFYPILLSTPKSIY